VPWAQAAEFITLVKGTWKLDILWQLGGGAKKRPGRMLAAINEANARRKPPRALSRNIMWKTLEDMRNVGLIERASNGEAALYWLTEEGKQVLDTARRIAADPGAGDWRGQLTWPAGPPPVPGVDFHQRPSMARVWDSATGGHDNFAADRQVDDTLARIMPTLRATADCSRAFLPEATRELAGRQVRQFLDVGTGMPNADAVGEVAQAAAPESRVVYVDNDPQVVRHAQAELKSSPEGRCDYVLGDLRDPGEILVRAGLTLDLDQPVGLILMMVLHFIGDSEDPWGLVRRLAAGIRGPVYLVIGHAASDHAPAVAQAAAAAYNELSDAEVTLRSKEQVARFFDAAGCQMLPPGLVSFPEWFPCRQLPLGVNGHIGIGFRGPR
jgi:DNA-binding HxlR family transcriptional regulator